MQIPQSYERLANTVRTFCGSRRKLGTPNGSFNRCAEASRELADHLRAAGLSPRILRLSEGNRYYPRAHSGWTELGSSHWWVHYVVEVDGIAIDCTMRQFDPDADFPDMRPLEAVMEEWGLVWELEEPESRTPLRVLKDGDSPPAFGR